MGSKPQFEGPQTLRIAIAGGGPAGLCTAIGFALHGHHVHVFERLDSPERRGTVNRDRSQPVVISGRGMAALGEIGAVNDGGSLRRHTFPFWFPFGQQGLIGSRDGIVLGLLAQIADCQAQNKWRGHVDVHFKSQVASVDLSSHFVEIVSVVDGSLGFDASAILASQAPFDLIVACDGIWSPVRDSAALQDQNLVVSRFESKWQHAYKTVNLDLVPKDDPYIQPGEFYDIPGVKITPLPEGGALGLVLLGPEEIETSNHGSALLKQRLGWLMKYVTAEEEAAFDARRPSEGDSGVNTSSLIAGDCVALVGDSATSFVHGWGGSARGGANHAFDMSACLLKVFAQKTGMGMSVAEILQIYNEERIPDEKAYAAGQLGMPHNTEPYRYCEAKGKGKEKGKGQIKDEGHGKGKGTDLGNVSNDFGWSQRQNWDKGWYKGWGKDWHKGWGKDWQKCWGKGGKEWRKGWGKYHNWDW